MLACIVSLLAMPGFAQGDESTRLSLRERWMQRQSDDSATDAPPTQPGDFTFTLRHDGLLRTYRLHVPASYSAARPTPLLVALHGGGGSMDHQADDARYGLIGKSEREGFILVFPNGFSRLRSGKLATWNAGECCGTARDRQVDDAGFIRQVVAKVARQMTIDRHRIYAAGMSNGGMMAYRLACEMADVFRAVASVAGTHNARRCAPARPVSVLHIHARNDTHVLFDGGAGEVFRDPSLVTDFTSVPATVSTWTGLDGCPARPRRVLDRPDAYCERYSPCRGGSEVQLCVTATGGHSWPGGNKRRGEPASQAISATDLMWDFFSRH